MFLDEGVWRSPPSRLIDAFNATHGIGLTRQKHKLMIYTLP